MKRFSVNKHRAAKAFRHKVSKTKIINLKGAPMRGGIRL